MRQGRDEQYIEVGRGRLAGPDEPPTPPMGLALPPVAVADAAVPGGARRDPFDPPTEPTPRPLVDQTAAGQAAPAVIGGEAADVGEYETRDWPTFSRSREDDREEPEGRAGWVGRMFGRRDA
ncbi:hypothetical protein [Actinoalloteichus spitiensis]|uniref:hypothetical protein n=1 Tax=Actinoalloteichus spitiensis TaxID=252394 RepID=UPI0012F6644B|nr:hypothetical protein [Actinoalloteichus spitiensis]